MCAKPYHTKNIGNKCIRSLLFIILHYLKTIYMYHLMQHCLYPPNPFKESFQSYIIDSHLLFQLSG